MCQVWWRRLAWAPMCWDTGAGRLSAAPGMPRAMSWAEPPGGGGGGFWIHSWKENILCVFRWGGGGIWIHSWTKNISRVFRFLKSLYSESAYGSVIVLPAFTEIPKVPNQFGTYFHQHCKRQTSKQTSAFFETIFCVPMLHVLVPMYIPYTTQRGNYNKCKVN